MLLDTGEHRIGGFSQQQSGPGDPFLGVTVSSQLGQFPLSSFPQAEVEGVSAPERIADRSREPGDTQAPAPAPVSEAPAKPHGATDDILGTIERLAKLRDQGALSEEEFSRKKTELLGRL